MTPENMAVISAAVLGLTALIKWSPIPTGGFIPVAIVFTLALIGVVLWAISNEPDFDRHKIFSYFAAWVMIASTAAGLFGFGQASAKAVGGGDTH